MKKVNNFIYALKIKERVEAFRAAGLDLYTDRTFAQHWINIRGLSTYKDTIEKYRLQNISEDEFIYSIKIFNKYEIEILENYMENQKWYIEYNKLMKDFEQLEHSDKFEIYKSSVIYAVRPFLNHSYNDLKNIIKQLKNVKLSDAAIEKLASWEATILINTVLKLITLGVHQYKEKVIFSITKFNGSLLK